MGAAQLAHVVCIVLAVTIVAFVTAVLGDGRSVIVLKDSPPIVTDPAVVEAPLDALLGKYYGIGLHHDVSGRTWNQVDSDWGTLIELLVVNGVEGTLAALPTAISAGALMHPVPFLSCFDLEDAGRTALGFGVIADVVAVLMVLVHVAALAGLLPNKVTKLIAVLVWFVLTGGFFIVMVLAVVIYTKEWTCHNPVIPTLTLSDSFDFNYGFPFAVIGMVGSLLAFLLSVFVISSKDDTPVAVAKKTSLAVDPTPATAASVSIE